MVPRITEHVNAFQETIQNKYRSLLQNKSEQLNDQEKSEFIDFLEQNRQQIAKEQGKLGDDMLQHINKIMEEQTVLNALRVDVDKIKEEILDNKNRIMGLQRQERELEYEIKELNQIATEKDMASNAMRAVGVGSLAVSAVGVVLTPMTGGASLLLSGTGGALAAYSLSTAEEYRLAAKQKRKEADQVRQEMIRIQSKIDRLNTEINTKESQIEKKNQTIASILDDQNILRRILEQLSKFMDIINNLKAVLPMS
ncbi:uncharacterized protein LOC127860106 [Dreissena polymorpha]|nr:uncharacterized protein LOC127860106 [Dreissena polymorpha]